MRVATLSALLVALAFSFAALAQQPATPASATTASTAPTVAAAATMSPQECGKMMDKMASASDKSAMPMKEGCNKSGRATKKKAKNKHNHSQFHKGTG